MRAAKGCWNCLYSFIWGGMMVDRRKCNKHFGRTMSIDDWEIVCDDWEDEDSNPDEIKNEEKMK